MQSINVRNEWNMRVNTALLPATSVQLCLYAFIEEIRKFIKEKKKKSTTLSNDDANEQ